MNHPRLVQADDALCQRVVVRIADIAHGGLDAGLRQAFRVAYGQVLHTPVAVVHETLGVGTNTESLLQCVEGQLAAQ